ncbi:MAG: hypothetical protein C0509_05560 [Acinetobacter sp.]|nr:hypothetical protein [Acinetobacter sp.]MDZ4298134.1 hypothetical protein [Moraxellaceae bacterium]MDZ4385597.1 hypothetical protein [Moraxellaceae bacterium]
MTQIDPIRLTRLLNSLSKPKSAETSRTESNSEQKKTRASKSDHKTATLKARLHERLSSLKANDDDFNTHAPRVTIQEILCWEFGDDIVQNKQFEAVVAQIAESLMKDKALNGAVQRLVERFLERG